MSHPSTLVELWTDLSPVCSPSLINTSPSCQGPAPLLLNPWLPTKRWPQLWEVTKKKKKTTLQNAQKRGEKVLEKPEFSFCSCLFSLLLSSRRPLENGLSCLQTFHFRPYESIQLVCTNGAKVHGSTLNMLHMWGHTGDNATCVNWSRFYIEYRC